MSHIAHIPKPLHPDRFEAWCGRPIAGFHLTDLDHAAACVISGSTVQPCSHCVAKAVAVMTRQATYRGALESNLSGGWPQGAPPCDTTDPTGGGGKVVIANASTCLRCYMASQPHADTCPQGDPTIDTSRMTEEGRRVWESAPPAVPRGAPTRDRCPSCYALSQIFVLTADGERCPDPWHKGAPQCSCGSPSPGLHDVACPLNPAPINR